MIQKHKFFYARYRIYERHTNRALDSHCNPTYCWRLFNHQYRDTWRELAHHYCSACLSQWMICVKWKPGAKHWRIIAFLWVSYELTLVFRKTLKGQKIPKHFNFFRTQQGRVPSPPLFYADTGLGWRMISFLIRFRLYAFMCVKFHLSTHSTGAVKITPTPSNG